MLKPPRPQFEREPWPPKNSKQDDSVRLRSSRLLWPSIDDFHIDQPKTIMNSLANRVG
jgi:hypothetical protein